MDKARIREIHALVENLNEEEKTVVYLLIARHLRHRKIDKVETTLMTKTKRYKFSANVDFVEEYR